MSENPDETTGTSHLFGRLSSKEEGLIFFSIFSSEFQTFLDLFDSIGTEENLPNLSELDLIRQMDELEFETNQVISQPEPKISAEKSAAPIPTTIGASNTLDSEMKEKIKSYWKPPDELQRIFIMRAENKSINNTDFDLICQVGKKF